MRRLILCAGLFLFANCEKAPSVPPLERLRGEAAQYLKDRQTMGEGPAREEALRERMVRITEMERELELLDVQKYSGALETYEHSLEELNSKARNTFDQFEAGVGSDFSDQLWRGHNEAVDDLKRALEMSLEEVVETYR